MNTPPDPLTGDRYRYCFFEVTPPSDGYYKRAVRNRYDRQSKKWQTESTEEIPCPKVEGDDPHTAMGKAPKGKIHLPVLDGYSVSGSDEITQDRNGNYFLHSDNERMIFLINLQKKRLKQVFNNPPQLKRKVCTRDHYLKRRSHSFSNSEQKKSDDSSRKTSDNISKRLIDIRKRGKSAALDLQYRLFNESTAENYIQNLDASEELECYSANTLFAALLRGLEVPTRLVEGFLVDDSQKDKTVLSAKKVMRGLRSGMGKAGFVLMLLLRRVTSFVINLVQGM